MQARGPTHTLALISTQTEMYIVILEVSFTGRVRKLSYQLHACCWCTVGWTEFDLYEETNNTWWNHLVERLIYFKKWRSCWVSMWLWVWYQVFESFQKSVLNSSIGIASAGTIRNHSKTQMQTVKVCLMLQQGLSRRQVRAGRGTGRREGLGSVGGRQVSRVYILCHQNLSHQ